jgi:hypothetical protein
LDDALRFISTMRFAYQDQADQDQDQDDDGGDFGGDDTDYA